jgi:hypothetical protein
MTGWSRVRITLARTPQFPQGSASHAYELIIPLAADNRIDQAAFKAAPGRASVQHVVPNRPPRRGAILLQGGRFVLSYAPGDADDEAISHLENHPLGVGDYVTITEPGEEAQPYRVESVTPLPPNPDGGVSP